MFPGPCAAMLPSTEALLPGGASVVSEQHKHAKACMSGLEKYVVGVWHQGSSDVSRYS